MNIISGQLQGDLVLPTDGSNIIPLYKLLRVAARITEKCLIAEVKVPILNNEIFELDKIISIPKKKSERYYQLISKYPYIGSNIHKDSLVFLSELDLQACRHLSTEKVLCFLHRPIYNTKIKQSICDVNIVDGGADLPLCKSEVSNCKESWTKLHADNEWLFTCCEQCIIRLICPSGITSQVLIGSGVIRLGPVCTLKGNDFIIYSHNYYYNKLNINQRLETPKLSVLNNIINTSSINIPKEEPNEKEWKALRTQLSELKEQSNSELRVHDIHHYSLGYSIVGLIVITGGFIVFRWLRRRRQLAGEEVPHGKRDTANASTAAAGTGAQQSLSDVIVNVANKKVGTSTSDTSENVPNKVRNAVDITKTGARVDGVRRVRNQRVVLTCASREEVEFVTTRLKSNLELFYEEKSKKTSFTFPRGRGSAFAGLHLPTQKNEPWEEKTSTALKIEESENCQLQKLLSEIYLGDEKPSQLLRCMRALARTKIPDETLSIMSQGHLPAAVRSVLAVTDVKDLENLPAIADKTMENTRPLHVAEVNNVWVWLLDSLPPRLI
ncbi:unnamed protein product [Leptidea sinapis]|uniref:Uncharacterized protein n=1 Tax=Leptidea sinapis TaxID=189913 RepID=A0A5E4R4P0_9NEOP|nr:unnamed protein product [Leptidea sinapis]